MDTLTNELTIGSVSLNVKNLTRMREFYTHVLLLDILKEEEGYILLGKKDIPLIALHSKEDLAFSRSGEAGLYHFAILFSSRGELARVIKNILRTSPTSFSGTSDHLVSEAFYFYDPEGNGIELYFDRDRNLWQWKDNQVQMATLYIDPLTYIERYIVLEEEDTSISLGHIHLKVGDIQKAKAFYVDILGFTITAQLPQALFISIGGYHHHIGLNSWESFGAEERTDTIGLRRFNLLLSKDDDLHHLKERLKKNNISYREENESLIFSDPWKNEIEIRAVTAS